MPLLPGVRLGTYEVIAPLGAGGMGEVYRAHDTNLRRDVAIKVLPAAVAADPARIARFEREARAVAALTHPNILAIHDFGNRDGVYYAVSDQPPIYDSRSKALRSGTARTSLRRSFDRGLRRVAPAIVVATGIWYAGKSRSSNTASLVAIPLARGIAVLPFENIGEADQAYFTVGMTEEVTSQLSKISALRVMSRNADGDGWPAANRYFLQRVGRRHCAYEKAIHSPSGEKNGL
jgi:hypothetical protein